MCDEELFTQLLFYFMNMKRISNNDIQKMSHVYRLNLINSINGYKAANLIGTKGALGENLAIFSSVIHLGSNPPLLGFIMRPTTVERDTYRNIKETGVYTINHIHEGIIQKAHYTSAKFNIGDSEFEKCKLTPSYLNDFKAPYVAESFIKIGLNFKEEIPIPTNKTILIVGEIEEIHLPESSIAENGQIDLNATKTVAISGLNQYHQVNKIATYPYARVNELPHF